MSAFSVSLRICILTPERAVKKSLYRWDNVQSYAPPYFLNKVYVVKCEMAVIKVKWAGVDWVYTIPVDILRRCQHASRKEYVQLAIKR